MPNVASYSPWRYRNAQVWLAGIADQSGLMHSIDELLSLSGQGNGISYRAISTLLILLGREGTWPVDLQSILRKSARSLSNLEQSTGQSSGKRLTIQEHHAITKSADSIRQELEILRRRAGMSNIVKPPEPPVGWVPFWSKDSDEAPWHVPEVKNWLADFHPWHNYAHHIKQMLERKYQQFPFEIRAAAGLTIILARKGLWPTDDLEDVIYLASTKLTHIRNKIFSKSAKNKELLSDDRFRILIKSMDEENKILSSRMSRVRSDAPEKMPCTWEGFWA